MSKILSTVWNIEPHTEAKHAILKKYLNAWLPIMTRYNGTVLYIDGFAGPGEYIGGKPGSPIIALDAIKNHKFPMTSNIVLIFIEKDPKRYEYLKSKIDSYDKPKNIKVITQEGKFDETLTAGLNLLDEQKKKIAPSLVFIDPFGFTGIPLSLIKRIMENSKCEVIITFMYEEINRFISLEKLWPALEATFGTDKWRGVIQIKDSKQRSEFLHNLYSNQLEKEAGIKFVRSFKMTNKQNRTDYYLFFGTNSVMGLKKMKEAMWKVDQSGMFQFSDATFNPSQPTLLEIGPNFVQLKNMLIKEFKGKKITLDALEEFVIIKTPFRETHYKNILKEMEIKTPPEIKVECGPGIKRRLGTYGVACNIIF